ncbi:MULTISPECIES: glycosyltransferase family 2 protein [unclassified Methylophilus]|uniref:glycosyltransferase family 2 protein n=1 Tax=unclassified Methylophilus TaxID=2630143 RepID=UPI00037D35DB|nr:MULTISPECIES: glycosyltransferase family 2 protein [unclassified Methylophilus]
MPKVSIICPVYNSELFLNETIDSVINQSFIDWELILIDDYSTDSSKLIIESTHNIDNRIKFVSLDRNSGPAIARNKGIEIAGGEYIAFIDSDDIWHPLKLEKQIKFMESEGYLFNCSQFIAFNKDSAYIRNVPRLLNYKKLLLSNPIGLSTAIYNCKHLGKHYFENVGHEDYLYWLTFFESKKIECFTLQQPLVKYRLRPNSVSKNKFKAALWTWALYRKNLKLSRLTSAAYFLAYVIKSITKRLISKKIAPELL